MTLEEFSDFFKSAYAKNRDFETSRIRFRDCGNSTQFASKEEYLYDIRYNRRHKAIDLIITDQPWKYVNSMSFFAKFRDFIKKNTVNVRHDQHIMADGGDLTGGIDYNPVINQYTINYGNVCESILDHPVANLDQSVWTKTENGDYALTDEASSKIGKIVDWAVSNFNITDPIVHITGSIASNSFDQNSDIDVHFCSDTFKPDDIDAFNKIFREKFDKTFGAASGNTDGQIGGHPIEIYFQENPFQDMMSVGCYDYTNSMWEVGPDMKDTVFDPYSEYYKKDMSYVDGLVTDIRNKILEVYEKALVFKKAKDEKFKSRLFEDLLKRLSEAAKLFGEIRGKRKALSVPKSKEEALKLRNDRQWHIADSAFKLLDKFGYLGILREYTKLSERKDAGETLPAEQTAESIINTVRDTLQNNKMLSDSERAFFTETENDIVNGMPGWRKRDLIHDIRQWVEQRILEYGMDIRIRDIALHGSRIRGDFNTESDLDAVVYYKGTRPDGKYAKEDHIYNMLNDEPSCRIDGIEVDLNPIRDEETGSISDYMKASTEYDSRKTARLEEGMKSFVAELALAFALSIPGIVQAGTLKKAASVSRMSQVQIQKAKQQYQALIGSIDTGRTFGTKTFAQACNILALTLFGEGRQDLDNGGMDLIIDSILNRSSESGKINMDIIADVCTAKGDNTSYHQYSFWNKNRKALGEIMKGVPVVPSAITNVVEHRAWDRCIKLAVDVYAGNRVANDKQVNSYYATSIDEIPDWDSQMVNARIVGHHKFGYVKSNDPKYTDMTNMRPRGQTAVRKKPSVYVVKNGDSLWKIAKLYGTTVSSIAGKNGLSKDAVLRPGQRLKL